MIARPHLRIFSVILPALLAFFAAHEAARAEITQADIDGLIQDENARFYHSRDGTDVFEALYLAADLGRTLAETVKRYARIRNLSPTRAERELNALFAIRRHLATCGRDLDLSRCRLFANSSLVETIRAAGFEDESGQLFKVVGVRFAVIREFFPLADRNDLAKFLNLISGHPAHDYILLAIFAEGREFEFLVPLLARDRPHPFAVMELAGGYDEADIVDDLALVSLARNKVAARSPGGVLDAVLTRTFITALLEAGQSEEAARIYGDYAHKDLLWKLSDLPPPPWRHERQDRAFDAMYAELPENARKRHWRPDEPYARTLLSRQKRMATETKLNLAAAMLLTGERKETENLLNALSSEELSQLGPAKRQAIYFLRETWNRRLNDEEIFRIFLNRGDEYAFRTLPPILADALAVITGKTPGWLDVLQQGEPAIRELGYHYLLNAGYTAMARYVLAPPILKENRRKTGIYEFMAVDLGEAFSVNSANYRKRIGETEAERKARIRALQADVTPTPAHVGERPVVFEERNLPPGVKPFTPVEETAGAAAGAEAPETDDTAIPKSLQLPVHPYQVVRLEKTGEEHVLIFLSQALDPVGEVSGGGYWVVKSRNRGQDWELPVYLGLQQFFPYVVTPRSNLPLTDGGALQIEVQVRELDTDSITFPPIGLRARREQDGLYLRFEWEKLTLDTDRDGLTDLAEHRMGLDPANPDTDGDGRIDGSDSLPLTAFRKRKPEENELAIAILNQVLGYERAAIIVGDVGPRRGESLQDMLKSAAGPRPAIDPMHTTFMVADPGIFSGVNLPARLLVYGPDAADRLAEQYGVFYPVEVAWVFTNRDGTKHHVIWNASWTGGAFIVRRTAEGYKVEVLTRWIT